MRKNARESVFVCLYRDLFCDWKDDEFVKRVNKDFSLDGEDIKFADELYTTIKCHEKELLDVIASLSKGFLINRVFPTDKCALLIGLCELTYFQDTPAIVAIDEAVGLSKKYSAEKSHGFVNGILAEYKKKLEGNE